MKSFLLAILTAIVVAVGAAYVLDTRLQRTVEAAYSTAGVRL